MSTPPRIRTEADAHPPRPGWAKTLGVCHIVVATLVSCAMLVSMVWVLILAAGKSQDGAPAPVMMGMDEPRYIWFLVIDVVTGLIANGFTFASGVALFNLNGWGARVWRWLAPAKIVRLVVLWSGFIVAVAPRLALGMGRSISQIIQQGSFGSRGKRLPSPEEMALVYAWMFLAMGIGMIVLGSIYPAATWWLVRRPGLRLALVDGGPGVDSVVLDPSGEARLS